MEHDRLLARTRTSSWRNLGILADWHKAVRSGLSRPLGILGGSGRCQLVSSSRLACAFVLLCTIVLPPALTGCGSELGGIIDGQNDDSLTDVDSNGSPAIDSDRQPTDSAGNPIGSQNDRDPMIPYRIVAHNIGPAEWEFEIIRTDNRPIGDLRFFWNFGPQDTELHEGRVQRYAFDGDGGDFNITATAIGNDQKEALQLVLQLSIPPLPNLPPQADAGDDLIVYEGDFVCLNGAHTIDRNDDKISYRWRQIAGIPVDLETYDNHPAEACFTAPAVNDTATLIFVLWASDGDYTDEDLVEITIFDGAANVSANAGDDVFANIGETVILDGSASFAADGAPITYAWTQIDGLPVDLLGTDGPVARFVAPFITETQEHLTFALTVTAGEHSAVDVVQATIWREGAAPATEFFEDFDDLATGANPPDWLDTRAKNSLDGDDGLFGVMRIAGEKVFGTASTATNIHAHYLGSSSSAWGSYTFSGRMKLERDNGGIGVTFLSDYPGSDRYYRLRSGHFPGGEIFHIAPHGTSITSGNASTGVAPTAGKWYQFVIDVADTGEETEIKAKVWEEGDPKPSRWQVECADASNTRFRAGTIGVWSMGGGQKYWDDLNVTNVQLVLGAQDPETADTDGDGVPNLEDGCPDDPAKIAPGECGCGVADLDLNENGVYDCHDEAPLMLVSRTVLSFGVVSDELTFDIWNAGGDTLAYTVSESADWLSVSPARGESTGEHDVIRVRADRANLSTGTFQTELTVTPNVGPTVAILVTLLVQPPSDALTPIARWDVVPRQRINAGETFKCGVVAFSKYGIEEVRFDISGQGYRGQSPKIAREMTYNDRTDVWEYWVPIAASDFRSDGMITVEATVVGKDGGIRDKNTTPGNGLESLVLWVNPNGSLPSNTAWVANNGNDNSGKVNDASKPFASISAAMKAIAAAQGGKADGGIVRLRPGNHSADGGGIYQGATVTTVDEWITITSDPAAGGNKSNTSINHRETGDLTALYLKASDLTLSAPGIINGGNHSDAGRYSRSVWLKNCDIQGDSSDFPFPVGSGWRGPHYYTECSIDNQRRACGNGQNHRLMRNLTITDTREDVFQSVPFGINITIDGVDPGPGSNPEHADVIQGPPALTTEGAFMHNWIWYNVIAKDLHYQGIFVRSGATSKNNAFVNCLFEMRAPIRNDVSGRGTTFAGKYDHLLFWNCTFLGTNTINKFNLGQYESTTSPSNAFLLKNISVVGCLFERFRTGVRSEDKGWINHRDVEIVDNHYITSSDRNDYNLIIPRPADNSLGDPKVNTSPASSDFGRPRSDSPLRNQVSPPRVPADATGRPHGSAADIGALAN